MGPILGEEQMRQIVDTIVKCGAENGDGVGVEVVEDEQTEKCDVNTEIVVLNKEKTVTDDVPQDLIDDIIKAKASIRKALKEGILDEGSPQSKKRTIEKPGPAD